MIRVLAFALYGPLAASTRHRLAQYVPGLEMRGIDLQICHLLDDDYLRSRFGGGPLPVATMLRTGIARLGDLIRQPNYDVVILHCELFPLLPGWIERALLRSPYIYDFDDAFYLKYRSGRLGLARPLLGDKFDTVIAGASAVNAGNHVLQRYALQRNTNSQYLPTVVDTDRYLPERRISSASFTVGWIGSPSTAGYLDDLVGPLSVIGAEGPVRFVVIGGRAPVIPGVDVVEVVWEESTEVELINSFDVGVMPLPDDEWARGKCAFKLIQYMACAVAVIAAPVGANVDVVTQECGFLAGTPQEWIEGLRTLRDDAEMRCKMGLAGRQRVKTNYSLGCNLPVLENVIRKVAKRD